MGNLYLFWGILDFKYWFPSIRIVLMHHRCCGMCHLIKSILKEFIPSEKWKEATLETACKILVLAVGCRSCFSQNISYEIALYLFSLPLLFGLLLNLCITVVPLTSIDFDVAECRNKFSTITSGFLVSIKEGCACLHSM